MVDQRGLVYYLWVMGGPRYNGWTEEVVTSRACAPSPASRSSLRAKGDATTRLPDDATATAGEEVGFEGVATAAAGAATGAVLAGVGAGVEVADGAMV